MTNMNILKEKIRPILEIRYKPDRKPLKDDLKAWIKNQPVDFILPLIDDMTIQEIGIAVNCGLRETSYHKAMERIKEYKDQAKKVEEKQPTDKTPSSEEKTSFEDIQSLEDFDPDIMEKWVHATVPDVLQKTYDMIYAEIMVRQRKGDP